MAKGKRVVVPCLWPAQQIFGKPGKPGCVAPKPHSEQPSPRVSVAELREGPAPCSAGNSAAMAARPPLPPHCPPAGGQPLGKAAGALPGLGEEMRRWGESITRRSRQHKSLMVPFWKHSVLSRRWEKGISGKGAAMPRAATPGVVSLPSLGADHCPTIPKPAAQVCFLHSSLCQLN